MDGFIGILSNTFSTTVIHPIDVIKTNYQVAIKNNPQKINNIIKLKWRNGGLKNFYRGLSPNILTYPIFWGVFFEGRKYNFYLFKNRYLNNFSQYFLLANFASTITNPLFVIKTKLQTVNRRKDIFNMLKDIYRYNGLRGFFKGYLATILNNLKLGIQFPLYDHFKDFNRKIAFFDKNEKINIAFSSTLSKLISSSITYPLDLIRLIQRGSNLKISIIDIVKNVYKREGIIGLYRGILLYNFVSTGNFVIMMITFETLKKWLL
jgi:solute carrier family 25 folate transporter 32